MALGGCNKPVLDIPEPGIEPQEGKIVLKVTTDGIPVTRATVADSERERLIKHLDIFIFKDDEDKTFDYHERVDIEDVVNGEENKGTITLSKAKEEFDSYVEGTGGTKYLVYIIANSTAEETDFESIKNLSDLSVMTQTDERIHLTGISDDSDVSVPGAFLMDGGAYAGSVEPTEEGLPVVNPVVLNDNADNNINLTVKLRRAAAKFIVTLTKGKLIDSFNEGGTTADKIMPGYYIKSMPVQTRVLRPTVNETEELELKTSTFTNGGYFSFGADQIVVTGYLYAHSWENSALNKAVRLVVNIPMTYKESDLNGEPLKDASGNLLPSKTIENNWYQVPLTRNRKFDRNTCYEVKVEVNAKGNEQVLQAMELTGISYDAVPWTVVGVEIGTADENAPRYLTLNEYDHEFYNVEEDQYIEYSSSAKVTVEVVNYWFVDKLGQTQFRYDVKRDSNNQPIKDADGNYTTLYDADGSKTMINSDSFGGTQTGTKPVTTIYEVNLSGMTKTQARNLLQGAPYSLSRNEADAIINPKLVFDREYEVSWTTYENTGKNNYKATLPTARGSRLTSINDIKDWLIDNYGLTDEEATASIQSAENTGTLELYNNNRGDDYYTGTIEIPREEVQHNQNVELKGMTYSQARDYLKGAPYNLTDSEVIEIIGQENSMTIPDNTLVDVPVTKQVPVYTGGINVTAQEIEDEGSLGLTGKIKITSEMPTNNTIRYIEVKITNDNGTPDDTSDDISRTVIYEQYPLEYIVNIQSWYSYRSDFQGTTYEKIGTNRRVAAYSYSPSTGTWSYSATPQASSGFFDSMYATPSGDGSSSFESYYWESGDNNRTYARDYNGVNLDNARIYHVRITKTSAEYTLGRPRITNGITDGSADNAVMVSPSFMIASQLGAVYPGDGGLGGQSSDENRIKMAASHCEKYVEVYKDPDTGEAIHLHDWRLPTKAEIEIIAKFQDVTGSAIDEVLAGDYYCSASGMVQVHNGSDRAIRCIRDAYELPSQSTIPVVD